MADYEDILYDNHPFRLTHPSHVGAIGSLFGMDPAPMHACRVLELGCGLGGNIVPLGALFPHSEFVGVDLSQNQIAAGQADVKTMGLTNVHLHAMDILDITPAFGQFDYIICHGVFSWVPPSVQARIMAICRVHLAPQGLAYISYNTYPGWHVRGMIREVLRRHSTANDPLARIGQARELLNFIYDFTPADQSRGPAWLKGEVGTIRTMSDAYVLYEHLVEVNTPLYFTDFVQMAAQNGLQYVGDAEFHSMTPAGLGQEAAERVQALARGLVQTEQYLDYARMRYFRRSIICHHEVRLDRALTAERLHRKWVTSRLKLHSNGQFETPEGMRIQAHDPLVESALKVLANYPQGLDLETLCQYAAMALFEKPKPTDRAELGATLLELLTAGAILIGLWRQPWDPHPGERPVAFGVARHQAKQAKMCTNLRHEALGLDSLDQAIIARLDGRSRPELADAIAEDLAAGRYEIKVDDEPLTDRALIGELVDQKLEHIARRALIVAPGLEEDFGYVPSDHHRDQPEQEE